jgi:hypothetical protein
MAVFLLKRPGMERFDNIETEHDCVADIAEALRTDGVIVADLLLTHASPDVRNTRIVHGRTGLMLTALGIEWIANATARFEDHT